MKVLSDEEIVRLCWEKALGRCWHEPQPSLKSPTECERCGTMLTGHSEEGDAGTYFTDAGRAFVNFAPLTDWNDAMEVRAAVEIPGLPDAKALRHGYAIWDLGAARGNGYPEDSPICESDALVALWSADCRAYVEGLLIAAGLASLCDFVGRKLGEAPQCERCGAGSDA